MLKLSIPLLLLFGLNSSMTPDEFFQSAAARMPFLCIGDVLYNRPCDEPYAGRQTHDDILLEIRKKNYDFETLINLLHHSDPKVRTLVMVELISKDTSDFLPYINEMIDDPAETFFEPLGLSGGGAVPSEKLTVGDIAKRIIEFQLRESGDRTFSEFWEKRKDRDIYASWLLNQLLRATGGTSPVPKERLPRLNRFKDRITVLPEPYQTWILLWLYGESGTEILISEHDLIEKCKALGPEALLMMLDRKIPTDDPDLLNTDRWFYKRMVLWVLQKAELFFEPNHADEILAIESRGLDPTQRVGKYHFNTSYWAIAAARLKPAEAKSILHDAFNRFRGEYDGSDRSNLAAALFNIVGGKEEQFIIEWFYKDGKQRSDFLNSISESKAKSEPFISRIIHDPRFEDLDWQSLKTLVKIVNGWQEVPVVTEKELENAWHPLGGSFHRDQEEAKSKYPKETEELLNALKKWREELRKAVPPLPSH